MYGFVRLPVGEENSKKRLQDITNQLIAQKGSRLPMQLCLMDRMFALFPICVYRCLEDIMAQQSGLISSVVVPPYVRNIRYATDEVHRSRGGKLAIAYNRGNYCKLNILFI